MVAFPRRFTVNPLVAPIGGATAGIAVAVMFVAVPTPVLEDWVWASGVPALIAAAAPPLGTTARAVLALAGAAMAASVTWSLLYLLVGPGGLFAAKAPADAVPAVRRADAHPDAPPRRPMTAADLGTPLMDVTAPPPAPAGRPVPADLDQRLASFDPGAIPDVPLPAPARVAPLARAALSPRERMPQSRASTVLQPRAAAAPVQPTIDALLRRLEEVAAQRRGLPAG